MSGDNDDGNYLSAMLARHEGERTFAYDDENGIALRPGNTLHGSLTIGIGRNLSADGLSATEIGVLLNTDIARAEASLTHYGFFAGLTGARRAALVDMMFNLGPGTFSEFNTFITLMTGEKWIAAAQDLLTQTAWAKEVPSRAKDIASMIATGDWCIADTHGTGTT
jgi:GH24 family phage-related lysozyme (muramidase)